MVGARESRGATTSGGHIFDLRIGGRRYMKWDSTIFFSGRGRKSFGRRHGFYFQGHAFAGGILLRERFLERGVWDLAERWRIFGAELKPGGGAGRHIRILG